MDEMDPTLTVLELARDVAQQKYLHSLEDSITNVEFSAHLTALNDKSEMSEVDDSCPHQEDLERGSTATPPQTAHKRQRAALARFVKKIKQRAEAASARAGALPVLQLGADINPAQEGWRTWNKDSQDTNTVGDKDRVGSKTSTCSAQLIDLPTWLDHRQDRTYEYKELGYSATVSSFTRSRHREQRFAQNNEAEYKKPTNSERRSAERTRREFRLKEDEEECYMLFKKFDSSTTRRALEDYKSGSRSTEKEKLNKLRAAMPKSKIIVSKDDMDRFFIVDSGTRLSTTRVWGCDAWKLDHMHKSGSFGRKAKKMIYVGISPNRKGWVLFDPASRKTSTTYHCTFDEDMSNRRCALRDYDLRRHKAGPSATADDERLAKLERSLYDDSPIINYNEPPNGAEEAYLGPRSSARGNDNMTRGSVLGPLSPKSSAGGNDKSKPKTRSVRFQQPVGTPQRVPRESGARGDHHQHEDERATARVQQRSATRSVHQQEGSSCQFLNGAQQSGHRRR
jgi:hypothetical protein